MPSKIFEPTGQTGADIQSAINAASAVAPATVLLDSVTYTDVAAIITAGNVSVIGNNTRLMPPATGTVDTLSAQGVIGAVTSLTTTAPQWADVVSVASISGIAVGSLIEFRVTYPNAYDTNVFEHRAVVLSVNGNDVSIAPELPFEMVWTATHFIRVINCLSGIRVEGITFDANGNAGASRGFLGRFLTKSLVEGCKFEGFGSAAGLMMHSGLWNKVDDVHAIGCGSLAENDLYVISQTLGDFSNFASRQASGFGPGLYRATYCNGRSWSSIKAAQRGIKISSAVACGMDGVDAHQSGSTGLAITNGCHNLQLGRVRACRNQGSPGNAVGVWFSDRGEHHVTISQLIAHDNATRDIRIFASNHDNVIRMADYGTLDDFGINNTISAV